MSGKDVITMFLCGDVMLGRGVDQILHYPSDPALHEDYAIEEDVQWVQKILNREGLNRQTHFIFSTG